MDWKNSCEKKYLFNSEIICQKHDKLKWLFLFMEVKWYWMVKLLQMIHRIHFWDPNTSGFFSNNSFVWTLDWIAEQFNVKSNNFPTLPEIRPLPLIQDLPWCNQKTYLHLRNDTKCQECKRHFLQACHLWFSSCGS